MAKKKAEPKAEAEKKKLPVMAEMRAMYEKKYPGMVYAGLPKVPVLRIPSGVFMFDLLTGGGIPRSRFTTFYGFTRSGKTTLALRICQQFRRWYPNEGILYCDNEGGVEKDWGRRFIDPNDFKFITVRPPYGELGVDVIVDFARKASDLGLIVVDSVAMMIPTAEAESSASEEFVGKQAKLVNRFIRCLNPLIFKLATEQARPLTILLINHARTAIGKRSFQPIACKPGGSMQDNAAGLEVRLWAGSYVKSGEVPIKAVNTFAIEKNRLGLPRRSGEYSYYLLDYEGNKAGEPDDLAVVMTYAKRSGILERKGNEWAYGKHVFKTLDIALTHMAEDPDTFNELKTQTLEACIGMSPLELWGGGQEASESAEQM